MASEHEKTELEVHLHKKLPESIFVSKDGEREAAVFLPRSQASPVEGVWDDFEQGDNVNISLPIWLAQQKGLI